MLGRWPPSTTRPTVLVGIDGPEMLEVCDDVPVPGPTAYAAHWRNRVSPNSSVFGSLEHLASRSTGPRPKRATAGSLCASHVPTQWLGQPA